MADCIISHNIWKSDSCSKSKYLDYGLEKLTDNFEKITYKKNPILYILSIIDTIEPFKIYNQTTSADNDAKAIAAWKVIDLSFDNNVVTIKSHCKSLYGKLCEKAHSLTEWVDVEITDICIKTNSLNIKLNLK